MFVLVHRMSWQLTSKPCFSEGTHTSLLAAQSAWLAAENIELLELGDPGAVPDDRKRVTSLAPPPVGLDMVLLALGKERIRHEKKGATKSHSLLSHFLPQAYKLELCRGYKGLSYCDTNVILCQDISHLMCNQPRTHIYRKSNSSTQAISSRVLASDGLIERHSKSRRRQEWKKDREMAGWRAGGVEEQRDTSIHWVNWHDSEEGEEWEGKRVGKQ